MHKLKFEAARAELSAYVVCKANEITKRTGKTYKALPSAPSTLAEMQAEWALQTPFTVWSGASEQTIYLKPWQNYAFRFWHDSLHVAYCLDTGIADEMTAARLHLEQARAYGLSVSAQRILWADTAGQSVHCGKHGEFPSDQLSFVRNFLS